MAGNLQLTANDPAEFFKIAAQADRFVIAARNIMNILLQQ